MMKRIFAKIFGVTEPPTTAAAARQQTLPVQYLPEHKLTAKEIAGGVGPNGECWEPWRTEHNSGLRWYRRISAVDVPAAAPPIHGYFDPYGDPNELDEFGLPKIKPPSTPDEAVRKYELLRVERKLRERQEAFPMLHDVGDDLQEESDELL